MNAKKLLVSFLAVMSMLLFVVTVSAATELVTVNSVKVDGISMTSGSTDISVIAGETIAIEVFFESLEDASDVRIEAQLKGSKIDAEIENFVGDLENGKRYREVMTKVNNVIDVQKDCGSRCRTNEINEFVWKLKQQPEHHNFI